MEGDTGALQRSTVLMGSAFAGVSSFHRHYFSRVDKHDFAEICKDPELSEDPKASKCLFGDELSSKIKKNSEKNKLFNKDSYDHKTSRPKKSFWSLAASNSAKHFHKNIGGFSTRKVVFRKKQWKNKSDE